MESVHNRETSAPAAHRDAGVGLVPKADDILGRKKLGFPVSYKEIVEAVREIVRAYPQDFSRTLWLNMIKELTEAPDGKF